MVETQITHFAHAKHATTLRNRLGLYGARLARAAVIVAFLSAIVSPARAKTINQAKIIEVDRPKYGSGIISTYAMVNVIHGNSEKMTLFIQYYHLEQFLPRTGDVCQIEYKIGSISGQLRSISLDLKRGPRVRTMRCGSGQWSEAQMLAERRRGAVKR